MKLYKYIIALLMGVTTLTSCDESKFLEEKPLDFYSPENAMQTTAHFNASINYLYGRVRHIQMGMDMDARFALRYATDFAFNATDYHVPAKLNDYKNVMIPTGAIPKNIWKEAYLIISNANVILNRLTLTDEIREEEKKLLRGETLLFRAYAYRLLANLFGGVPLSLDEIDAPRRDFVRATREEVYIQCQIDLEESVSLLPNINEVKDGKVSKQIAQHLLSEIYICLNKNTQAVEMASSVINHPAMGLMSNRFGSRVDEKGDVYWDLFRLNNQNRSSGNKESLWVMQYDYLNAGSKGNNSLVFTMIPFYQGIKIDAKDASGNMISSNAFLGVTDGKGGRGIGWMQPTSYFFNELWGDDFDNDIRNSDNNIIRDVKIENQESPAFGKWLVKDGYLKDDFTIRNWYPIMTKVTRVNNVPEEYYQKDVSGAPLLTPFGEHLVTNGCNSSFKDEYLFRLAETYLLRAEAYVNLEDKAKAAADINMLRVRANATPVDPSKVDIDYILDERLRELYAEELRMQTLTRLGKLVDRNIRYNPKTGPSIEAHHNLWPIPYSEIERNVFAVIEQNPTY